MNPQWGFLTDNIQSIGLIALRLAVWLVCKLIMKRWKNKILEKPHETCLWILRERESDLSLNSFKASISILSWIFSPWIPSAIAPESWPLRDHWYAALYQKRKIVLLKIRGFQLIRLWNWPDISGAVDRQGERKHWTKIVRKFEQCKLIIY